MPGAPASASESKPHKGMRRLASTAAIDSALLECPDSSSTSNTSITASSDERGNSAIPPPITGKIGSPQAREQSPDNQGPAGSEDGDTIRVKPMSLKASKLVRKPASRSKKRRATRSSEKNLRHHNPLRRSQRKATRAMLIP